MPAVAFSSAQMSVSAAKSAAATAELVEGSTGRAVGVARVCKGLGKGRGEAVRVEEGPCSGSAVWIMEQGVWVSNTGTINSQEHFEFESSVVGDMSSMAIQDTLFGTAADELDYQQAAQSFDGNKNQVLFEEGRLPL